MSARAAYAGATDTGLARSHNEDAYLVEPPLFAVADGLGGHMAGEVASAIAIETLREEVRPDSDEEDLAEAVRRANARIAEAVSEGRGRFGMGTTLTAALVRGTDILVAHVGDSRAYLLGADGLKRVTRDHSLVGELVRKGTLTEEEARHHPNRSVITRALGSRPDVEPDTYRVSAGPGDRLLLCSDGLHGMIRDNEIEDILLRAPDAQAAVEALLSAALDAGGLDNVTVIVVEIGETPQDAEGRSGRRWLAALGWLLAATLLVGAACLATYQYARHRAYVIDEGGVVTVYRGIPGELAGIELSWREQVTDVRTADLHPRTAARLAEGIPLDDLEEAMDLVAQYRLMVSEGSTVTP
ncbi:MAG: protein phosphatase 2C domain-containing protein [Coriobacteriia bacterium]